MASLFRELYFRSINSDWSLHVSILGLHDNVLFVYSVWKKVEACEEDSDVEADTAVDDRSQMLSDAHDVKLRHCGFCGIQVCTRHTHVVVVVVIIVVVVIVVVVIAAAA